MSDFILQIEKLLSAVGDAEYRYLLLEPLIFYGIFFGVVMLVVGYFVKAPKLQTAALVAVGLAAFAHVPYKDARLAAQPRMEKVYKISSPARVKGFNENTRQWVATSWKFKLLVLAALATVMIGVNRNRLGFGLAVATAVLGLVCAKNGIWLHYQDAVAYHPNLKVHEAPIDQSQRTDASSTSPSPAPNRSATRAPASATSRTTAPSALAQPLSAAAPESSGRIPAPEVPAGPRQRSVKPLTRY